MSAAEVSDNGRTIHFGNAEEKAKQIRLGGSKNSTSELMADYDFVLCSQPQQLRDVLALRLDVFNTEQGFPADTEVDEYDPISAHFALQKRKTGQIIGTVRLTPYPRDHNTAGAGNVSEADTNIDRNDAEQTMGQNETSMVTSGGGPQGTSGGLPMFSSTAPETKTQGTPAETASDTTAREEMPLGRPLSLDALRKSFADRIASPDKHPFSEAADAPIVRGAKLSRLAVAREERAHGCGALLVRQSESWLMSMLSSVRSASPAQFKEPIGVVLSSQMPVVGFYEALGYTSVGEPYAEEGAPHTWCLKELIKVEK